VSAVISGKESAERADCQAKFFFCRRQRGLWAPLGHAVLIFRSMTVAPIDKAGAMRKLSSTVNFRRCCNVETTRRLPRP